MIQNQTEAPRFHRLGIVPKEFDPQPNQHSGRSPKWRAGTYGSTAWSWLSREALCLWRYRSRIEFRAHEPLLSAAYNHATKEKTLTQ
jgi:hypothetical protein